MSVRMSVLMAMDCTVTVHMAMYLFFRNMHIIASNSLPVYPVYILNRQPVRVNRQAQAEYLDGMSLAFIKA